MLAEQGRLTKEDVDMRMCKTLADMPSDLALEAVDKFAMASLDTVRSKTGFMVGQPSHALFFHIFESALVRGCNDLEATSSWGNLK